MSDRAKRLLLQFGNALLGLWLVLVLLDYYGAIELPGYAADLALLTVLVVIANMIWKYGLRPFLGRRAKRS